MLKALEVLPAKPEKWQLWRDMPYSVQANGDGTYKVINELTGKVHAKKTSKKRAERQVRLMEAYDNNPGWRGRKMRRHG